MNKHTPGPWSLETVRTQSGICHKVGPFPARRDGDKPRHACLYADYPSPSNPNDAELEANARLIAAAPELYGQHEADMVDLDLLAKAIHAGDPMPELVIRITDMLNRKRAAIAKATGEPK